MTKMQPEKEEKVLSFNFIGILTKEFAVIDKVADISNGFSVEHNFEIGTTEEEHTVGVSMESLINCGEKLIVKIRVVCVFDIEADTWDNLKNEEGKYVLPQGFATHLFMLTVGTTRGVLHAKLENTPYSGIVLPTANITELIKGDISI